MEETDELMIMRTISQTLDAVDDETKGRIIRWIVDKYGISVGTKGGRKEPEASLEETERLEDLWVTANPETQSDKVLVVGSWLQVSEDRQEIEAFRVNRILKNLGHGIPNITSAFDNLIEARPQLAIQVKKSGVTRQARKKYRITAAGIQRVKEMIAEEEGN